jgi:ABC-type nickel/cobalt efflux system permease component RcnA
LGFIILVEHSRFFTREMKAMETISVVLIVALAVIYVGRKLIKSAKGGGCSPEDCASCCGQTKEKCPQKDIEDIRDL